MSKGKPLSYCFVFVCQQGELEIKALLLAASLKRYLRCDHELVAAVPQPPERWGTPAPETLALLSDMDIRVEPISNGVDQDYPIANKIACLGVPTEAERLVFLDSDILCMREFHHDVRMEADFSAKPADMATFPGDAGDWEAVYRTMGLPVPATRMRTTVTGEQTPPYFNAGMLVVRPDSGIADAWLDCARLIDGNDAVDNKRPWLDQIALPVALMRQGIEFECLDEQFNYPAHIKPLADGRPPLFCHYHFPQVLRREPCANRLVLDLVDEYAPLGRRMRELPGWRKLLEPYTLAGGEHLTGKPQGEISRVYPVCEQDPLPELIITGIPRSGTSYLCNLLHRFDDVVVINEPLPVFNPLVGQSVPWGVARYYRELRRDILDGIAVENKVENGTIIEDTAVTDRRAPYLPRVSRPDFLLATKNTLAYLSRLPRLREAMPHAPVIACVRNPYDTIASWKASFPHLRHARVENFPVGHLNDPLLPPGNQRKLQEISAQGNEARKRALLWNYLADNLLEQQQELLLLRYEDLVTDTRSVLDGIIGYIGCPGTMPVPAGIGNSAIRSRREILDLRDREAIRDLCGARAARFGYAVDE